MGALLQAQVETLYGTTFTTAPSLPFFGRGQRVWKKADFSGALSSWNNSFQWDIVDIVTRSFDDAGTERVMDKDGNEVTNAGTQPDDTTTGWFYRIVRAGTTTSPELVHESELMNEAQLEAYLSTQVSTFIQPI